MFERFSENARRALFFARNEVSLLGNVSIEPEHILLGLLRSEGPAADALAAAGVELSSVRDEVARRRGAGAKIPTSLEIPFSPATKRVLELTAREADDLRHADIGTGHLLLGLLREDKSDAFAILHERGVTLRAVRERMQALTSPTEPPGMPGTTEPVTPASRPQHVARIERIKGLVQQLVELPPDANRYELAQLIHEELEGFR